MTELKPCPFCGGEVRHGDSGYSYPTMYWVRCGNCGSRTTRYTDREAAARAWNTRAVPRAAGDDGRLVERMPEVKAALTDEQWHILCDYVFAERDQAADAITALSAEVERLKADGRLLINDCDCIGMKSPMLENFRQALGAKP